MILDPWLGLDDMSDEYFIDNIVVPYYILAFSVEINVIVLLKKFPVPNYMETIVTWPLIIITAIMLAFHVIQFFVLIFIGNESNFVQIYYGAIINTLHTLYAVPITIGIIDAMAEQKRKGIGFGRVFSTLYRVFNKRL